MIYDLGLLFSFRIRILGSVRDTIPHSFVRSDKKYFCNDGTTRKAFGGEDDGIRDNILAGSGSHLTCLFSFSFRFASYDGASLSPVLLTFFFFDWDAISILILPSVCLPTFGRWNWLK
jgi:hypothetical protein